MGHIILSLSVHWCKCTLITGILSWLLAVKASLISPKLPGSNFEETKYNTPTVLKIASHFIAMFNMPLTLSLGTGLRHRLATWISLVGFSMIGNRNIFKTDWEEDTHDDVIKWKDFLRYWSFVRGIHRSPVNSPHKGQWPGALIFSLILWSASE